jgi:hypothetical protein
MDDAAISMATSLLADHIMRSNPDIARRFLLF